MSTRSGWQLGFFSMYRSPTIYLMIDNGFVVNTIRKIKVSPLFCLSFLFMIWASNALKRELLVDFSDYFIPWDKYTQETLETQHFLSFISSKCECNMYKVLCLDYVVISKGLGTMHYFCCTANLNNVTRSNANQLLNFVTFWNCVKFNHLDNGFHR